MKRISFFLVVLSIFATSLFGCSEKKPVELISHEYVAMDTIFSLSIGELTSSTGDSADDIFSECESLTSEIESVLSASEPNSDVYIFNSGVDAIFDANSVFTEVLSTALNISEITDGAYDPALGALTTLWNVKGGGPVPSNEKIEYAMSKSGSSLIKLDGSSVSKTDPDVKLDLGGIGKGFVAQRITEHLFDSGVPYGIVSAGRTVGVFGEKPDGSAFKIGIADPFTEDGVLGYFYTKNGFVSVAGDYEIYFEEDGVRYHHIIDPSTGKPSDSGLSSVAVFSQNGATADALSTALLVMGYDRGIEFYKSNAMPFEAIFIGSNGSVKVTDGLTSDRFELSESYKSNITTSSVPNSDTTVEKE